MKKQRQEYDEHFKISYRKAIAEKRAKCNADQAQIDKFLEREWVDVITKDHSISPRKMKEREEAQTRNEIKRLQQLRTDDDHTDQFFSELISGIGGDEASKGDGADSRNIASVRNV